MGPESGRSATISSTELTEGSCRCAGVVCSAGQKLTAPVVVSDPEYLSEFSDKAAGGAVSRAVCIHDRCAAPWRQLLC